MELKIVDYNRQPDIARLIAARYKLGQKASDIVIFDADRQPVIVSQLELADYNREDVNALMAGKHVEIRRATFTAVNHRSPISAASVIASTRGVMRFGITAPSGI